MAVAFVDQVDPVGGGGSGVGSEQAGLFAQAHRATHVDGAVVVRHRPDDRVGGLGVELDAIGALQVQDVPREFDDRRLQPQAEAQIGDLVGPRIAGGFYLAFDAARPESTGDDDAVDAVEHRVDVAGIEPLGVDPADVGAVAVVDAGVADGLLDADVGVGGVDVFAHQGDIERTGGPGHPVDQVLPGSQVDGPLGQAELAGDDPPQAGLFQEQRDGVDVVHRFERDDGLVFDITEQGQFFAGFGLEGEVGAAGQDVGEDADAAQGGDAVLGGFGLQFAGGADMDQEGEVDVHDVFGADFTAQLAQRLKEGQALDVADGAADFHDDDVGLALVA